MIFIIPLIFGAVALVTGGLGIAAGVEGMDKMNRAKEIGETAKRRLRQGEERVEEVWEETQRLAEGYGRLQLEVQAETIGRFVRLCQRLNQKVSYNNSAFSEDLGLTPPQLEVYQEEVNSAVATLQSLGAAGTTAYVAAQGAIGTAALFGTASTGTAIGSLSGAAAWKATLAWLGGGSLAAGGGGMALGTWILGGIAAGPALMLGGLTLGSKGEEALTQACAYDAKVDAEVAKMEAYIDFLGQVQRRIAELEMLVVQMNRVAIQSLDKLERKIEKNGDFDPELPQDAQLFQRALLLNKALSEVMKIAILDKNGNLNPQYFNRYYQALYTHSPWLFLKKIAPWIFLATLILLAFWGTFVIIKTVLTIVSLALSAAIHNISLLWGNTVHLAGLMWIGVSSILAAVFKALVSFGAWGIAAARQGISFLVEYVEHFADWLWAGISSIPAVAFKTLISFSASALSAAGKSISSLAGYVGHFASWLWTGISSIPVVAFKTLISFGASALSAAGKSISFLAGYVGHFAGWLWTGISSIPAVISKTLASFGASIFSAAGKSISFFAGYVGHFAGWLWTGISSIPAVIFKALVDFGASVLSAVGQ